MENLCNFGVYNIIKISLVLSNVYILKIKISLYFMLIMILKEINSINYIILIRYQKVYKI